MPARTPALVAVPLALLLAACGGATTGTRGGGTPAASPTATGLSKADYLSRSEDVCARANANLPAPPNAHDPASVDDYFTLLEVTISAATDQLTLLAHRQPDRAELDRMFLTPLQGQVKGITAFAPRLEAALKSGPAAVRALGGPTLPAADLAAMRAYGFKACVKSADTSS
ncbi:MAG: hypothetical protein ACXVGH_13770 [Mycobacteriales bacterium]